MKNTSTEGLWRGRHTKHRMRNSTSNRNKTDPTIPARMYWNGNDAPEWEVDLVIHGDSSFIVWVISAETNVEDVWVWMYACMCVSVYVSVIIVYAYALIGHPVSNRIMFFPSFSHRSILKDPSHLHILRVDRWKTVDEITNAGYKWFCSLYVVITWRFTHMSRDWYVSICRVC